MPTRSNPPDDVEGKIEKHLELLRDSIELKLLKEVDAQLKARFESTGKIIGIAFGLVAVVFTAFGVKTIFDVKDLAKVTAINEVQNKLEIDDPNSEFRRDVDKVVARALINSYLLTLASLKRDDDDPVLNISDGDFRRFRILVSDPETSIEEFSDVIEILLKSNIGERAESVEILIQAIGTGAGKAYGWIADQPEKRAALLKLYQGEKLIKVSGAIMADEEATKTLLIAAIRYAGLNDKQSGRKLENLAKHKDSDIASEAVLALAKVEPSSPSIKAVLDKPIASKLGKDWATALRVAFEISRLKRGKYYFNGSETEFKARALITVNTLRAAIANDFIFRTSLFKAYKLGISTKEDPMNIYMIPEDILFGPSSVTSYLFQLASQNEDELTRTIRAFCLEVNGRCTGSIITDLAVDSKVILNGGVELGKVGAPGGISIRPENSLLNSPVIITWRDIDSVTHRGTLSKFLGAEKNDFAIVVAKSVGQDIED
ncbi:hypothetical protein [Pseudomonas chlororaphis]|uniref:hypothetical protein n=1 Tax=Pseudomonas chlororaphis TaxID=587753 RepID=UPI001B309781|nr:hypothetical protein [Pseudomonas chlororaphis]QTT88503.1 hypothetical protein HUT28_14360 [Pseudomonas chlororaphis]